MRIVNLIAPIALIAAAASAQSAKAEDSEGCKDQFVSRMAGFEIGRCDDRAFDAFVFAADTPKSNSVEGHIIENLYVTDAEKPPSRLAVRRNYENAFRQGGWTVVNADEDMLTVRKTVNGAERWAQLMGNNGDRYQLVFAEKGAMEQSVTSAEDMLTALNKEGHIALQINFDTAKATIRPDSQATVAQILELLKNNPSLKLNIEGHTDNAGTAASNKLLSENRAKAVMAALVARGINAARLTSAGYGQDRPVADNKTEEGRAKNRRVELVRR